ncbi:hypothetical protein BDV97DRAFT_293131 [Delphinella strobiligena]|nr:hypothetical protein BDV97DRAFT_293131 [Delphinella strobiligena]
MLSSAWSTLLLVPIVLVIGQQQCYFGPGAESRGPAELIPCLDSGPSSCCLLGDTCLSGNTCYNYLTGDLYQYGCTDITYTDSVCPHAPESCGCVCDSSYDLLILESRGCKAMGEDARVALYAPSVLVPYVSLPSTIGGSTGYYSITIFNGTSTWISTAVSDTPATIAPFTTYKDLPTTIIQIDPGQTPSAATNAAASSISASASSTASSTGPKSTAAPITNDTVPGSTNTVFTTSGLSTGAKAGIGVGAGLGVSIIATAAIFFLLRQRRQKAQPQIKQQRYPQDPQTQGTPYHKPHDQAAWPGVYPGGGPQMPTPYHDPNRPSFYQEGTSHTPSPQK